jgi:hypothetical protein
MVRSVVVEHVKYSWEEYLLYEPSRGFRWLVQSDHHWSLVRSVPPGEVHVVAQKAQYNGKEFKLFQKNTACVDHVLGEFYWKVQVGEEVGVADYIHPPDMLSREVSQASESREVNWSLGSYMTPGVVEAVFGVKGLPRPAPGNVAPNQPFLYSGVYRYWAYISAAVIGLGILFAVVARHEKVFDQSYTLIKAPQAQEGAVFFSDPDHPLQLKSRQNIRVRASASLENTWFDLEGDFINDETGIVQSFSLPVEYYHGVEGGESWSEGSREGAAHLSALPAGAYTLRLAFQWDAGKPPGPINVVVEQGLPRGSHWLITLCAVSLIPVIILMYHYYFSYQRWKDSPYNPFPKSQ